MKWLWLGLLGLCVQAQAQQMVLVHGFASGPAVWRHSGFVQELERAGWGEGFAAGPGPRRYWLVALPYRAPLAEQARVLTWQLADIRRRNPGQPLWLVGHSLGGVVARMALVTGGAAGVERLVTIASPHLGLQAAAALSAMNAATGPVGDFIAAWLPAPLADLGLSDMLMQELSLRPGTALHWLNRQPHPPLRYIAIVHTAADGPWLRLIPPRSQDLNAVPALRGRAETWPLPLPHALSVADARQVLAMP